MHCIDHFFLSTLNCFLAEPDVQYFQLERFLFVPLVLVKCKYQVDRFLHLKKGKFVRHVEADTIKYGMILLEAEPNVQFF